MAQNRFVSGLNGKNNMERAKIAMLILEMNDIIEKMVAHFMEPDGEKKVPFSRIFLVSFTNANAVVRFGDVC